MQRIDRADIEGFLQSMTKREGLLLHGSTQEVSELLPLNGKVYATDSTAIAMTKALISNDGANLRYPIGYNPKTKFEVEIIGGSYENCVRKGFVYLLEQSSFRQTDKRRREFVSNDVVIPVAQITVTWDQYHYPVFVRAQIHPPGKEELQNID